jgi:hypothetical protein
LRDDGWSGWISVVTIRTPALVALLLPLGLISGCQLDSAEEAEEDVGCGIVTPRLAIEAVGPKVDSRRTELGCSMVDPADPRNHLTIVTGQAVDQDSAMDRRCSGGWVYAGTPEKFEAACITSTAQGQTTVMVSKWDGVNVQVELGRNPRTIHDDAEQILEISRDVAAHLRGSTSG